MLLFSHLQMLLSWKNGTQIIMLLNFIALRCIKLSIDMCMA